MRIFLDLDDVLCDFVGPAAAEWGVTRAELEAVWPPGEWDMVQPLARALTALRPDGAYNGFTGPLTENQFWRALTRNEGFWVNLPPLPWARDLVALATDLAGAPPVVVTTPGRCPSSWSGKKRWLDQFFGGHRPQVHMCYDKAALAAPGRVLVDDSERNCDAWCAAGGRAVVFPRRHNRYHEFKDAPMGFVTEMLHLNAHLIEKEAA